MTGDRLTLEQFAAPARGRAPKPGGVPRSARDGTLPRPAPPPDADPDGCEDDLALMKAPTIRRAPVPAADPAVVEAAALREEQKQMCARLADVTASVQRDRVASIDAAIAEIAHGIASIGGELLPGIIDQGMMAEIAAAIIDLASRIPHQAAELHVAAADHELLAAAIAADAPESTITLISDSALASGQARMVWPGGGAELDAARLADRIAPLIAERLNGMNIRSLK